MARGRGKFYSALCDQLRAFAERTFALAARDEKGTSARDILEGLLSRTRSATKRAELEARLAVPLFPEPLGYLWQAFLRLSARRSAGFGVNPISWPEIDAFVRHSGMALAPWEVRLIEQLDDLYRADHNRKPSIND